MKAAVELLQREGGDARTLRLPQHGESLASTCGPIGKHCGEAKGGERFRCGEGRMADWVGEELDRLGKRMRNVEELVEEKEKRGYGCRRMI